VTRTQETAVLTPTSIVESTPTSPRPTTSIPTEDVQIIPEPRQQHTIIPIKEGITGSPSIKWADDGQSLIFSLIDPQWPYHVRFLPVYQNWWQYNLGSGENQPLPPLQSRVTDAVRQSLGVCPFSSPESASYPCLTTLQETPTSNRILYSSIETGIIDNNTWLANIDGSDSIFLDDIGSPEDVIWSSDGQWLLTGHYWGVDSSHLYYLVSSDGTFVENLETLTGTSHYRLQGPRPTFSPDGKKLAFVGIETNGKRLPVEQLDLEEAYNIYLLDLNSMELEVVSQRFGLLQWSQDGDGLYVLDGAANTSSHTGEYILAGIQYASLYYIDLTDETYPEQKLASDIPIYLPYIRAWAYSPETNAIAGTFDLEGETLAILFIE
jgi:hypothetical protein